MSHQNNQLTLHLKTQDGTPLDGGEGIIDFYHMGQARDRTQQSLTPQGNGVYTAEATLAHTGVWRFELDLTRGPERILHTFELMLE